MNQTQLAGPSARSGPYHWCLA